MGNINCCDTLMEESQSFRPPELVRKPSSIRSDVGLIQAPSRPEQRVSIKENRTHSKERCRQGESITVPATASQAERDTNFTANKDGLSNVIRSSVFLTVEPNDRTQPHASAGNFKDHLKNDHDLRSILQIIKPNTKIDGSSVDESRSTTLKREVGSDSYSMVR